MGDVQATPNVRGALMGAMISGWFGLGWSQWGASGLSGAAAEVIQVAGFVVGAVILLWCARLWRTAPTGGLGSRAMFSSPAYRLVVAVEVAAIIGGDVLLGAIGHREYFIALVAAVVGTHFLAFGRLFWAGFYWLGAALIAAGVIAALVGLAGGGSDRIEATSGLICAASLFVAAGSTIARARVGTHV